MKKYYLMAIELNNSTAMCNLAFYYDKRENNYDLMKKYYLMAIELNDKRAMFNLGIHYQNIEKNYDLMKKYYLMAIELNNSTAMNNLGYYYQYTEINYDLMKKYYLMAIEIKNNTAMKNLIKYYKKAKEYKLLTYICIKYNKYADYKLKYIEYVDEEIYNILAEKTEDDLVGAPNSIKNIWKLLKSKLNLIKLHFCYTLEGKGYIEAKEDYIKKLNLCSNNSDQIGS
jgi:TPR repeat protein